MKKQDKKNKPKKKKRIITGVAAGLTAALIGTLSWKHIESKPDKIDINGQSVPAYKIEKANHVTSYTILGEDKNPYLLYTELNEPGKVYYISLNIQGNRISPAGDRRLLHDFNMVIDDLRGTDDGDYILVSGEKIGGDSPGQYINAYKIGQNNNNLRIESQEELARYRDSGT